MPITYNLIVSISAQLSDSYNGIKLKADSGPNCWFSWLNELVKTNVYKSVCEKTLRLPSLQVIVFISSNYSSNVTLIF